jgi:galactose oxidase
MTVVNGKVREFIPGGSADGGTWYLFKTPLLELRFTANSVLLPDGTILVVGGSKAPTIPGSGNHPEPVYQPELYDPGDTPNASGTTRLLAASLPATWGPATQVPRLYHSMAFLLPDGRVFIVGGRIHQDPVNPLSDSRLSGELFYPPYLFEGDQLASRPTIDGLALSDTSWQQLSTSTQVANFAVSVTTQTGPVKKVTAIRVSSATHHFDSDQRYIELDYAGSGIPGQSATLTVTAPTEDVAPQGWYHLFVLEERAGGRLIPSVSRFVQFL